VDHFGLVSELVREGSAVYLNGTEVDLFLTGSFSLARINARLHGFPEKELQKAVEGHPGVRFGPRMGVPLTKTHDGQVIKAGDYTFECVETPGHSFGHTCLYEADRKILIAGDHILKEITPNIGAWVDDWNPLDEYLESLTEIARLDVGIVLPGHRSVFQDMRERIGELREHHRERAEEVARILKGRPGTAYEVASKMSWDIDYPSFDQFPLSQRWFATGEALAHLRHLESHGIAVQKKVEREGRERVLWSV
jgi:glyoxylase-like metal-dependent hydrolase (beta-lactamase superfamily II)